MIDAIRIAARTAAMALTVMWSEGAATAASPKIPTVPLRLLIDRQSGEKLIYAMPVHIGDEVLQGLLDTGSVPTLVLKGRVPQRDAQPSGKTFAVTYGGTRTFGADAVTGPFAVNTIKGAVGFGVVNSVNCVPAGSRCVTSGEGPRDAFFAGRLPVIVGARVIVGPYPVTTIFRELGIHRYLLTAPRKGEGDGTLELDPDSNATAAFVPIYNDTSATDISGTVQGCLRNKTTGASVCGAVLMDSGSTGIAIFPAAEGTQNPAWETGQVAQLEFSGPGGADIAGVDFSVGADSVTSIVVEAPGRYAEPVIAVGQLAYIGLSVLTDFDTSTYAVTPRSRARDGVAGHVP